MVYCSVFLDPQADPLFSGKTLFLYYLPRCRLLHAELPTIFQFDGAGFFLFSGSGVREFPALPFRAIHVSCLGMIAPDVWCLVDTNPENEALLTFLVQSMLSNPHRHTNRGYIGQRLREAVFTTSITSHVAIQHLRLLLRMYPVPLMVNFAYSHDMQVVRPSERQLHEWFGKFAPSARLAYK